MKILFVAPRLHTNQNDIIKGFIEKKDKVYYSVIYKGPIENYSYLKPIICKPSLITRIYLYVKKFKSDNARENWLIKNYIPGFIYVLRQITRIRPEIIILRERSKQSAIYAIVAKFFRIQHVYLYNQYPLYHDKKFNGIKGVLSKLIYPKIRITPVKRFKQIGDFKESKTFKNEYYIPFVQTIKENFYNANHDSFEVLVIGKYREYKNHFVVLNAVKQLYLMIPKNKIRISIVGQAFNNDENEYYDNMKKYLIENNLEQIVTLHKNIPNEKISEFYKNANIFILPSSKEMASISILEAISYGVPVISSINNGTAFHVLEGKFGYLFNPNNSKDLSRLIFKLYKNRKLLEQFSMNGIKYIRDECSFEKYYHAIMMMFGDFDE